MLKCNLCAIKLSRYFLLVSILFNYFSYSVNPVFGKYGSVKVDIDASFSRPLDQRWGSTWPEGIKLSNNIQSATFPTFFKFHNVTGYPYAYIQSNENLKNKKSQVISNRRTYAWNNDDLVIYHNTHSDSVASRISPPFNWLSFNGAKVNRVDANSRSLFSTANFENDEMVEIQVSRTKVEHNLMHLRGIGMSREDIFRMLDKGPWILAFDISEALSKLVHDLQMSLGLNLSQCKHIISHCPYLLAQYSRYKGKDLTTIVLILNEIGYSNSTLIDTVMRFPSILTSSSERLRGWMTLLQHYGIAVRPNLFGKMLRRGTFMFYLDPPFLFESIHDIPPKSNTDVAYEATSILNLLTSYHIPDLDKIIRTQPLILVTPLKEIQKRINFLIAMFSKHEEYENENSLGNFKLNSDIISDSSNTDIFGHVSVWSIRGSSDVSEYHESDKRALEMLHDMLLTYPGALSTDLKQMKEVCNCLRANGLTRSEIGYLIRTYPSLLSKSAETLQDILFFLKSYCGFRKADFVPALSKFPNLLSVEVESLKPKVDFLYQSLGGSALMLRKFPGYLTYDLDDHIKPRAEFLRAFNINPMIKGLAFLVTASINDLAFTADVKVDVYKKFSSSYTTLSKIWKKVKSN